MFDIIITSNEMYYIHNKLFSSIEQFECFKDSTKDSILIMESYLFELLYSKFDETQSIICLSHDTLEQTLNSVKADKKIFILCSSKLYQEIFINWYHLINKVYLNVINKIDCDPIVKLDNLKFSIQSKQTYNDFVQYILVTKISDENHYLKLLKDVYINGCAVNGRNGNTKSLFGKTLEFDLRKGFPLLTTKKMFFRGIVEELLFFIRGNTDTKILEDKNINIWKGNTNRHFLDSIGKNNRTEGVMGPMYGYQWRYFNALYDESKAAPVISKHYTDQLDNVIKTLRTNPHSRRILLSDYNPLQADEGVLFPCHSIIIQFYVYEDNLDMFCFNRSSDLFHGLPFNIASSALFLILIAKITNFKPRKFIVSLGDSHIYEEHINSENKIIDIQLSRIPFRFPQLEIKKELKELEDIEKLSYEDFILHNYESHDALKAKMVA
jgi:dihydrofolate reductase/thymidylate synthase